MQERCEYDFDGLAQDCSNFIANTLELLQSGIEPSNYTSTEGFVQQIHNPGPCLNIKTPFQDTCTL